MSNQNLIYQCQRVKKNQILNIHGDSNKSLMSRVFQNLNIQGVSKQILDVQFSQVDKYMFRQNYDLQMLYGALIFLLSSNCVGGQVSIIIPSDKRLIGEHTSTTTFSSDSKYGGNRVRSIIG